MFLRICISLTIREVKVLRIVRVHTLNCLKQFEQLEMPLMYNGRNAKMTVWGSMPNPQN